MRLLLDADLSPARVGGPLRESGHDVRGIAAESALEGLDDELVLELAAREGRILVTRNSRHFAPICRRWAEAGRDHSGVILIWTLSTDRFGAIVRGIERLLEHTPTADDWRGLVVSL